MKTSESVIKITAALLKAEAEIKHAVKDGNNDFIKNGKGGYATLESVIDASKNVLLTNKIIVIQAPADGVLTTRLQHESGEFIETELKLIITKNDMQGLGSAITYARRYSLAALLNISQSDDDGNMAIGKKPKPAREVPKQQLITKDTSTF